MSRNRNNYFAKDARKPVIETRIDGSGDGNPFRIGKNRRGLESGTRGSESRKEIERGIDPAAAADAVGAESRAAESGNEIGSTETAGKKRGPYKPRAAKKNLKDAVGTLTVILTAIHKGVADYTGNPELNLDDDESEALIESWIEVQQYYKPVAINPKTMAWWNFGVAFFAVYAKKLRDIRARKKAEAAKSAQPQRPVPVVVNLRDANLARVEPVPTPKPNEPHAPPPGVEVNKLTPSQLSPETGALDNGVA